MRNEVRIFGEPSNKRSNLSVTPIYDHFIVNENQNWLNELFRFDVRLK